MKALTIRQPHASLVAVGAKTIETRGFATSYRGPLLIHAGASKPKAGSRVGHYGIGHHRLTYADHVDEGYTLADTIGRQSSMGGAREYDTWPLPLGAVVASCQLTDCVPIVACYDDAPGVSAYEGPAAIECPPGVSGIHLHYPAWSSTLDEDEITTVPAAEIAFGDFSPGRYAWLLGDVKPTTERCPRCWGQFGGVLPGSALGSGWDWLPCPTCSADDHRMRGPSHDPTGCPPVPMRGRQGLWTPNADDWAVA